MEAIYEANADNILLMSEVHFPFNDTVNQQKCRYWVLENPRELHERLLKRAKVTVWNAAEKATVIGPFFLF